MLFSEILEQEGARLPADRRYANRQMSTRDGVDINDDLYAQIMALKD